MKIYAWFLQFVCSLIALVMWRSREKRYTTAVLICVAAFCLTAASTSAVAQVSSAASAINGTVSDPTGAPIPGAHVVLQNLDTNVERTTQTRETGIYTFLDVSPGRYALRVTKEGFATVERRGVTLAVNQTATFDYSLPVGGVASGVTVSADAAVVEASTAELGVVVPNRSVDSLPLNGRNFTELLTLVPGASPANVAQSSGGFMTSPIGTFSFPSINGQTNRSNLFLLDGLINQGSYVSSYGVAPIVDTIQEFKVQSHNDTAEFGGALGGIVNVITKAGTNNFHGSAWEFLRNNDLDARNPFLASVTPFKQNQFGASAGGPVILPHYNGRNKTFFFAGYEGFRNHTTAESLFVTPTPAQLNGDFSGVGSQIYDPFSTRPDPNKPGQYLRDPFPNNQIPADRLDKGMVTYAKAFYPAPVATGSPGFNGIDNTPNAVRQDEGSLRLDQYFGSNNFLWARYSGFRQPSAVSAGLPGVLAETDFFGRNWGVNYTHSSNSFVASLEFGRTFVRSNSHNTFNTVSPTIWQAAGFSPDFTGGFQGASFNPGVSVDGYAGIPGNSIANQNVSDIHQYKGDVSKILGRHTLRTGFDFAGNDTDGVYDTLTMGTTAFQTANLETPGGTGDGMSSFLLGVPDNTFKTFVVEPQPGGWADGFYVQDQWKVTSNLTINLGLRYDVTLQPIAESVAWGQNRGNHFSGDMDMNRGIYILGAAPPPCEQVNVAPCMPTPGGVLPAHVVLTDQSNHAILHNNYDNWQPRVGIAYRVRPNLALRASYGRFFDNWAAVTQQTSNFTPSWPSLGVFIAQDLNATFPTVSAKNPSGSFGLLPPPTPYDQVTWFVDPFWKNPYSDQWNFGIQRQLTGDTLFTANYVGSHTSRLDVGGYYNVALTPGPGNPSDRSPFPYFSPAFFDRSVGRGNYNALQLSLNKHYSNGLTYQVAYTWSKSIDLGCSGWFGAEGCSIQDPYHLDNDRSVSAFDLTQMLSANWVYELPFGAGKRLQTGNKLGDLIIGGWQLNGIVRFTSGLPYSVTVSGDIANTGNASGYERANLIGNPIPPDQNPSDWLNRSAFAVPERFTFGNLGRNVFRSDWAKNFNISIFRGFPLRITEATRLEFRADFFNATNTPVWGIPVSRLNSSTFGQVSRTANVSRQVQLGLKCYF